MEKARSGVARSELLFHNNDYRLGFHVSVAGRSDWADVISRLQTTPFRAYQIYVANSRGKRKPQYGVKDVLEAKRLLLAYQKYLCIHASLLYNPCGSTDYTDDPQMQRKWHSTLACLTAELDMGVGLGAGVVLHIGSCKYRKEGIEMIVKTLHNVLSSVTEEAKMLALAMKIPVKQFIKRRRVLLENAAGEGSKIGSTLEEIAEIIDSVDSALRPQVKVCLDTAHLFGEGTYDVGEPEDLDALYADFDRLIGLEKLELFHLNDSKVPRGSRKDRHATLGAGYIFGPLSGADRRAGLKYFFEEARRRCLPLISEPPEPWALSWNYVQSIVPLVEKVTPLAEKVTRSTKSPVSRR